MSCVSSVEDCDASAFPIKDASIAEWSSRVCFLQVLCSMPVSSFSKSWLVAKTLDEAAQWTWLLSINILLHHFHHYIGSTWMIDQTMAKIIISMPTTIISLYHSQLSSWFLSENHSPVKHNIKHLQLNDNQFSLSILQKQTEFFIIDHSRNRKQSNDP